MVSLIKRLHCTCTLYHDHCINLVFSLSPSQYFKMASCGEVGFTEESSSPLPRAPPPSPECINNGLDLYQFDFNSLLSGSNRKAQHSLLPQSSSTSNFSIIVPSPESNRPESEPTSPSWNGSGSYQGHSPFFLPSPEHQICKPVSDPPSPLSISVPDQVQPQGGVAGPTHQSYPSNVGTLSVSLPPMNGDLQHYHGQMEVGRVGHHGTEGKRRKISLKRSHEQVDQSWYSLGADTSPSFLFNAQAQEASQKKVCSEARERESRDYDSRSYSPVRARAYTHSGVMTSSRQHLSVQFDRLTLSKDADLLGSHTQAENPTQISHIGSHVIPQSMRTIGFDMSDNSAHVSNMTPNMVDDSMEMDVGGSSFPLPQGGACTKISITRADSIDQNSMETSSHHTPSFSLPNHKNSSFSFNLPPSNFNPFSLHPHSGGGGFPVGGALDGSGFRSSSEVLSHSL